MAATKKPKPVHVQIFWQKKKGRPKFASIPINIVIGTKHSIMLMKMDIWALLWTNEIRILTISISCLVICTLHLLVALHNSKERNAMFLFYAKNIVSCVAIDWQTMYRTRSNTAVMQICTWSIESFLEWNFYRTW